LEYRRIGNPGGGLPGTFADVTQGADHLRVLARTYPLDLNRDVVIGHVVRGDTEFLSRIGSKFRLTNCRLLDTAKLSSGYVRYFHNHAARV
jgi:hypothetical protein